jgi:ribosome-binding factor A
MPFCANSSASLSARRKNPRVTGLISITLVEVSKDLNQARVHVSVYSTEERANVAGLTSASVSFVAN